MKVRGLWYDDPGAAGLPRDRLRPGRQAQGHSGSSAETPATGGQVFFQDPITHAWHALHWTGMPPAGQMPAFGDARVRDLLKQGRGPAG